MNISVNGPGPAAAPRKVLEQPMPRASGVDLVRIATGASTPADDDGFGG